MLAIVTSHPIQYQAPLWRELARAGDVPFAVWFLSPHGVRDSYDRGFGRTFAWDVDLLEGYPHRFLDVQAGWRLDRFNGVRLQHRWSEEFRAHHVSALWVEGWRFRALWQAVAAARAEGRQIWLRGENPDLQPEPWLRRLWKRPLLQSLFRKVDAFLCIGSANRRFYRGYGIEDRRLFAAPYCVDNARFAAAAAELRPRRQELRARWGIASNAFCVLFCGKLIPKKRPLDLVEAAQRLPEAGGRPWHLLFAGDGELAPLLRDRLAASGAPRSTLTGFLNQSELPSAYAAADCLVLPSDHGETWGLVVNEALAAGLPVVVSDRCGCAEDLAAPLGAGFCYPCGDTAALARAVAGIALQPPPPERILAVVDAHAPRRTVDTVRRLFRIMPGIASGQPRTATSRP